MSDNFKPWAKDRRNGLILFGLGLGLLALALYAVTTHQVSMPLGAIAGIAGATLLPMALSKLARAKNRQFGKILEGKVTPKAVKHLTQNGFRVETNVMRKGLGDIDIVVYAKDQAVPIEIKSFRNWKQFGFMKGERERHAINQSRRQQQFMHARHGIIWLPQGRRTFLQLVIGTGDKTTHIVFGNERALTRHIKRII